MMSRKSWSKALAKLEMLPLTAAAVAAVVSATGSTAYGLDVPNAPDTEVASPAPAAPASTGPAAASSAPAAPASVAPTGPAASAPVVATAPAAPAPTGPASQVPVSNEPFELDYNQANKLATKGISLEVMHEDMNDPSTPIRTVILRGKMYKECVGHFNIVNTNQDMNLAITETAGKYSFGFKIIDDGHGLECVKAQNNKPCTTSSCVSLSSQFEGATMDTINFVLDGEIQLIHTDPNRDPGIVGQNIGPALKFESAETIRKRELAKAEEERLRKIEENDNAFKNCRHSLEELAVATKALNALIRDTDMALDDARAKRAELAKVREALEKKEIQAEFNRLKKRIAKAKDADEVESLSEDLAQFADDHPEYAKSARQAQEDLVNVVADSMGDSPASYALRKQIYQNAMGMEGVSASEAKSYRTKMTGLDIAQQATMYQSGNMGNMNYFGVMENYQKMMKAAQSDYKSSCAATKSNGLSDACAQAMKNMAAAQQLPSVAMTAYRQQQQQQMQEQMQVRNMQMEMERQMQQYMSSTMNVGNQAAQMPSFAGMMSTSNGFQNGFGQSNGFNQPNMGMNGPMNMMNGQRTF
ncbi:MAG: hypothetical protein ACJ763_14820 [Bdellovibrionia bacterium]